MTAFSIAGVPSVFKRFGEGGLTVPAMQALLDIGVFSMLYAKRVRAYFFQTVD